MKKLIYLFIAIATLQSCNDENDTNDIDPIIGTWKLISDTYNGVEEITECKENSKLYFNADGTYSSNVYNEDDNGDCILDGGSNGDWVNDGDKTYTFYVDGYEDEPMTSTIIDFSENNSVLTVTDTDTYNGETDTYISVFTRE